MAEYSYNGWEASPDRSAIDVVANDWFPGGVKAGDVSTVLRYVVRQLDARVEPIVAGWCWAYTYKQNVNNPSQLSCHASGTALDFNAPDHPNGSSGTFTSAQRGQIYAILDEVQGSVSWLEGYDEMHFEICVDAADLARVAAVLGDAAPPTPEPEPLPKVDDDVLQLLRIAGGDGRVYAASAAGRRFFYVSNPDALVANQLAGTFADEVVEVDSGQLNHVRYACQIQPDDDPAAAIP